MKLAWTPLAIEDREAIFDYIAEDNPQAAVDLDELFEKKASLLIEQPRIVGKPGRVVGTREYVAHRHYVLVYDVAPDRMRILRVLHTSLLWPPTSDDADARKKKRISERQKVGKTRRGTSRQKRTPLKLKRSISKFANSKFAN